MTEKEHNQMDAYKARIEELADQLTVADNLVNQLLPRTEHTFGCRWALIRPSCICGLSKVRVQAKQYQYDNGLEH